MSDLEEEYSFNCPYCMAEISIGIDYSAGKKQSFTYDCDICCRPIVIELELDSDGVVGFEAHEESE